MRPTRLLNASRAAALAGALAIAAAPAGVRAAVPPERLARAVAIVDSERVRLHVPGLAFAIVADGRVVEARGFGVRDLRSGAPVDTATVFPIGSCTKAFSAMAAIICQDQHRLALDDPPRNYLPWFRLANPQSDERVTIRDLLSHRTGLRAYADLAAEPGVLTREQYLRAAIGAKPACGLREQFQYSNAAVSAAGEIVGRVQGTTWEHAIERLLFEPLGMRRSVASLRDLGRFRDRAIGYEDAAHTTPVPPPASLDALGPAGSIGASVVDMTRWVRCLLDEGVFEGRRVVSAAGVRDAFTPHILARGTWHYGLGWVVHDWNGHGVIEHNGGSNGLSALVCMMPEQRLGFVILMNASPNALNAIGHAGGLLWPVLLDEPGSEPTAAVAAAPSTPRSPTRRRSRRWTRCSRACATPRAARRSATTARWS